MLFSFIQPPITLSRLKFRLIIFTTISAMKHLPLHNPSFIDAERSFKEWLDILGFAASTVYGLPNAIREFFHWLGQQGCEQLTDITSDDITNYYAYLKNRPNYRLGGGLSNAYLNKHQQAIKKFAQWLRHVEKISLPVRELHSEHLDNNEVDILTEEEIKRLFTSAELNSDNLNTLFHEALQQRDRAMLAVFYGCGLRRNEGFQLDITDINFDKGLLHVRKGKNYTERVIPISNKNMGYLRAYIHEVRQALLNERKQDALFVTARGTRMQGQSMLIRLKLLITLTGNPVLKQKKIGLHTLRHSI